MSALRGDYAIGTRDEQWALPTGFFATGLARAIAASQPSGDFATGLRVRPKR